LSSWLLLVGVLPPDGKNGLWLMIIDSDGIVVIKSATGEGDPISFFVCRSAYYSLQANAVTDYIDTA
jgi:hypothetical protein